MKYQILGGAGPYEAAVIVAAISRITSDQMATAAEPPPPPQQSAWVTSLWEERDIFDEDPSQPPSPE